MSLRRAVDSMLIVAGPPVALWMVLSLLPWPGAVLAVPALTLVWMLALWWRRGRDRERGSIAPRYEPPEGLTPAEAAAVADHRVDDRDSLAILLDLSARGYVSIERRTGESGGLGAESEYVFRRSSDPAEWEALHEFERNVLRILFSDYRDWPGAGELERSLLEAIDYSGAQDELRLSDLRGMFRSRFYQSQVTDPLYRRLVDLGYYESRPDYVRAFYLIAAMLAMLVFFQIPWTGDSLDGVAAILTGAAIGGVGWFFPVRTEQGARVMEKVLGFREFLLRVEKDRLERMINDPAEFQRLLAYAVGLRVNREWMAEFRDLARAPEKEELSPEQSRRVRGILFRELKKSLRR